MLIFAHGQFNGKRIKKLPRGTEKQFVTFSIQPINEVSPYPDPLHLLNEVRIELIVPNAV